MSDECIYFSHAVKKLATLSGQSDLSERAGMNRATFLQFRSSYVTCVPIPTLIQVWGTEGHVPHVPLVHYVHALGAWCFLGVRGQRTT